MSDLNQPNDTDPSPSGVKTGEANLSRQICLAFEALPDGVVIIDAGWRFTFANQRARELVANIDMVGHHLFELFPRNNAEPFNSFYRTTMATRVAGQLDAFYGPPLNTWYSVQAKPFGVNGDDDGMIVFFSDISERKRAELREQETASRLTQVLDAISDAVAMIDPNWRITYLNANARRLVDPNDSLIGTNVWEEFPDVVGSPTWDMFQRCMNEGVPGQLQMFNTKPTNAWLDVQAQSTQDGIVVFFRDITQERQSRETLQQQQALLADVQGAVLLATWDLDLATGDLVYGAGSYPVYGHPLETVANREAFHQIVHPDHREALSAVVERAVSTGERFQHDVQVTATDGSLLWLEARGQAVYNEHGVATRVRGMNANIDERKRNEASLAASEARYRVLADLNPQAIWMGDALGHITYANHGFMAYIGLTQQDLESDNWQQAFAPADRNQVFEAWGRSVSSGVDFDIEAHMRNIETGTYRWWHLRAAPVRDANGAVLNWLGVGSDVHDARTYAETLRAEQIETERRRAELDTIYRTTPIGLALLDPVEFRFLNLNDHEAEVLGLPKDRIIGRKLSEIAPPDKLPGLMEMMNAVARGEVVKDRLLEGELAARPGEMRAWRVSYSPIFNEDGSVRAISTASIEITNQKKSEQALIQSEKLAAVGRLASSISHEINNPLEAITNLLYLIQMEDSLPELLRGYVNMAQSELSRVSQIATQTLRFHRQAVAPTPVTAEQLVGAVVRLYTGRLANSNIRVDSRYDTGIEILCFENDIRQVLNNLIANAIDAMRTGGRLIIRAHRAANGVRITIADTGHGMSAKVQSRIFEPFFTTKNLNGTGLGLWISSGIVERHEGSLRLRSSEDPAHHGTVFTLYLPCGELPVQ
jgi:PAS domain S-box-containing protein